MDGCGILSCVLKDNGVLLVADDIGIVGGDFLHIVAANRQVAFDRAFAVPVKGNNLNQPVYGDNLAIRCGHVLGGIQPKGHIKDFAVLPDAVGFVGFKALYKVDFHTLTLVDKACCGFRYGDILTCVHKLNAVYFLVQYHAIRGGDFLYLISAKVQFLGFCRAVRTRGNGVNDFALGSSQRTVQRIDVLGSKNLIDRTLKPCNGKQRVVKALVACHGAENLARFGYGDSPFLCHVGAYHLDNGNTAFFLRVFLHHIKIDRLGV